MTNVLLGRDVLAITPVLDPAWRAAFQDAALRLATLDSLVAETRSGRTADLVVIDGDTADLSRLIGWMEGLGAAPNMPPLIVTGARLPTRLVRATLRLPSADLLETPFQPSDLSALAERLLAPPQSTASSTRCWSIMGSVGGCGATTIAAEIAAALAVRAGRSERVCLIDLNLADGAAAAYLGATPGMLLGQFADPARIDATVLSAFAFQSPDGFDVLSAPRDPAAFQTVGGQTVTRVLEVACQVYDWVIVDLPRHRHAWTLDVLSGSDELLLVSELTVPALVAARAQAIEIEAAAPGGPSPRIVLNRIASRMFAAVPSFAEAERALGRKAEAGVSSDWEAAAASANLGGVIRRHRPRSRIVKDVESLVQRLTAQSSQIGSANVRTAG
jgi:pilus assembly protein CpaE